VKGHIVSEERIILVGGGAFARELLSWILDAADATPMPTVTAFLDRDPDALKAFPELHLAWAGNPEDYDPQPGDRFAIALGDPVTKSDICQTLASKRAEFLTVVHPSAIVSRSAKLGKGVVIGPGSYVATHALLGDFACVNSLTGVGHDAVVGAATTISSQVDIMGAVVLADEVFVGSGARLLPKISVGARAKIGAGAIVVRSVKPGTTMFAKPAGKL
jgi:sugar O-acyltransferase (sialic acid O-acetyltransferase NeuD family)